MWLSVQQLADATNKTPRAIRKAIDNGRYPTARHDASNRRGGNKGKSWLIDASDPGIPEDIRISLGAASLEQEHPTRKEADKVAIEPDRLDDKAAQRLRVLQRAGSKPQGISKGDWYRQIAAEEDISVPTIYRWAKERSRGKVTSDRAPIEVAISAAAGPLKVGVTSRSFAPQALEFGLSILVQNPRMEVKRAYAEMAVEAERQGWEIGSLASFYRKWGQLPDAIKILSHSGRRGLEAQIKPAIGRDLTKYQVYEILVGDQHIFDYTVLDDQGEPIRPEMFCWGDIRSRYISGIWPVMGHYDKYAVGMALRESCRYGIPERLYTDWGRPERSNYVAYLRRQLSGYAAFGENMTELQHLIPHTKAKPRNAQAKPIESWFYHAFERPLMQLGLPGYSRQDKQNEKRNEFIQSGLRKSIKSKKLLYAKDFFEIVAKVVQDWNDHVMTEDKTRPSEVFFDGIQRPLIRLDDRTLDFLVLPASIQQVRKSMVAMTIPGWGKCRWYAPELSGLARRGKRARVEIRYDPYDPDLVQCLDPDSHKYICTAERWAKEDPHDMTAIGRKIRAQNELIKHWAQLHKETFKAQTTVHRFSPYATAAAQSSEGQTIKTRLTVDDAELNKKIINLAMAMGMDGN